MKRCPDYRDYRQPSLFPEVLKAQKITRAMYRRGTKSGKPEPESASAETVDRPEQLSLKF